MPFEITLEVVGSGAEARTIEVSAPNGARATFDSEGAAEILLNLINRAAGRCYVAASATKVPSEYSDKVRVSVSETAFFMDAGEIRPVTVRFEQTETVPEGQVIQVVVSGTP